MSLERSHRIRYRVFLLSMIADIHSHLGSYSIHVGYALIFIIDETLRIGMVVWHFPLNCHPSFPHICARVVLRIIINQLLKKNKIPKSWESRQTSLDAQGSCNIKG